jgi:hypothetical protein
MDLALTSREITLLGFYILVTQGIPWAMKTFFPAIWGDRAERRRSEEIIQQEEIKYRKEQMQKELEIKRELADKELELRREIAERDAIIDARNLKTMEVMEQSIKHLTEAVGAMTMQFTIMGREFSAMRTEQQSYFTDGRKAIQQIGVMAKTQKTARKK